MSNIRDLYKNKGKSLAKDKQLSKEKVNDKLSTLNSHFDKSVHSNEELLNKILKINDLSDFSSKSLLHTEQTAKFDKNNKKILNNLVMSFGLNYQRLRNQGISNLELFHSDLIEINPELDFLTMKDLESIILDLIKNGIVIESVPQKQYLFEPLTSSSDIHQILSLVNSQSMNYSYFKMKLSDWTEKRLENIIALMEQNNLLILDGEEIFFPFYNN